ncbi:hypothetical protein ACHAWF_013829 [Thalassiosira exigua]
MSMKRDILKQNYAGVRDKLLTAGVSSTGNGRWSEKLKSHVANRGYILCYQPEVCATFTALEWAFHKGDTKMATIFWIHGADPKRNAFNGVVVSEHCMYHTGIIECFDADDPRPVEGYAGLKNMIVNESDLASKALVWLMELLDSESISLEEEYYNLSVCFNVLENVLGYSPADFQSYVETSLLAIRRMGLTNATAVSIVESALVGHIRSLLKSYAEA